MNTLNCAALAALGCIASASASAGKLTILHEFGSNAQLGAGIIAGPDGTLYGTTINGGKGCVHFGCGTVFALSPPVQGSSQWTFSTLHEFTNAGDGYSPYVPLTIGPDGVLYGASNSDASGSVIFSLTPPAQGATSWTFTVLGQLASGNAAVAALILSGHALYGVASGGIGTCNLGAYPCGTVFQAAPSVNGPWTVTSIVTFDGNALGGNPNSIAGPDEAGGFFVSNSYGRTVDYVAPRKFGWHVSVAARFPGKNATPGCLVPAPGGTVYAAIVRFGSSEFVRISQASGGGWSIATLLTTSDHHYPPCPDILAPNGALLGTVFGDQDFFAGSVFQLSPPSGGAAWTYRDLAGVGRTGRYGPSNVVFGLNGNLYGSVQESYGPPPAIFELPYTGAGAAWPNAMAAHGVAR